ncbi:MAG: helix-turn-helix domain-containing protein [Thermacetogeniaceae bacterium]
MEPRAITVAQLQKTLNVGKTVAYGLVQSGEVKALRVGKKWLVPVTEVDRFLAKAAGQQ